MFSSFGKVVTLGDPVALKVLLVSFDLAPECHSPTAELVSALVELHSAFHMLEPEGALSHL